MGDRYRLPEVLGGGEVEVLHGMARPLEDNRVDCVRDGVRGVVTLDFRELTKVEPPLPPEPSPWSVVQIGAAFFERRSNGGRTDDWFDVITEEWLTWAQVCSIGIPTLLVSDPWAEPIKLPWTCKDTNGHRVRVQTAIFVDHVYVDAREANITADDARDMARALMALVKRAEADRS